MPDSPDKDDRGVASTVDAYKAIEGLSDADHVKLMLIARSFARTRIRGSVVEPEDLLQEAIVRTLDGRRTWKRSVSILQHLDRVMESVSGHVTERQAAIQAPGPFPEGAEEPAAVLDPSVQIDARDELADILDLFAHDKQALDVLHLRGEGFSASEIQQRLGTGKTQYETVTKRIRRRLAVHVSEGDSRP